MLNTLFKYIFFPCVYFTFEYHRASEISAIELYIYHHNILIIHFVEGGVVILSVILRIMFVIVEYYYT